MIVENGLAAAQCRPVAVDEFGKLLGKLGASLAALPAPRAEAGF